MEVVVSICGFMEEGGCQQMKKEWRAEKLSDIEAVGFRNYRNSYLKLLIHRILEKNKGIHIFKACWFCPPPPDNVISSQYFCSCENIKSVGKHNYDGNKRKT